MPRNKPKTLPSFDSFDDLVTFFERHDMGEYSDQMPEVRFTVNLKRRKHLVAIDEDISTQLTRIAKSKKVSAEALINSWLKEKIQKVS
ncbi:MAG: hypothetical protein HYX72_04090 [Acidobacteria bacterium]|nr:hypothetical protein [Acidobacteriota bacterium]